MILDTTVLIDLLRGDTDIVEKLRSLEMQHVPFATTSVSAFEVWQGVNDVTNAATLKRIEQLLGSLQTLSFDDIAAREAGSIHAILKKQGMVIDPEDSMIAGIVRAHHETLMTRNVKHFERIQYIKLESY